MKGKYAQWFEEEYAELIQRDKYKTLFADVDTESLPEIVHNGYFAQDNRSLRTAPRATVKPTVMPIRSS